MAKEYELSEIMFNTKAVAKREKNILDELDSIDDSVSTLPSDIMSKRREDKQSKKELKKALKQEKKVEELADTDDTWMSTLTTFTAPSTKKKTKNLFEGIGVKKKKKKKKQQAGELTNFKKEFEPELALLRSLQYDQDKFVTSIQKKYDQMENTKSTARGVGKFTTDLIQSITSARSLSKQLVTDIISTKQKIAELSMKEKKDFGKNLSGQTDDAAYASNFLKQMMGMNRVDQATGEGYSDDISDDVSDIFDGITENLGEGNRSKDSEIMLKWEPFHPVTKVLYRSDKEGTDDMDELYDFVTYTDYGDGDEIPEYPHQIKTRLQVNKDTKIAKDAYGVSYPVVFI